jgi:hypothetical protein
METSIGERIFAALLMLTMISSIATLTYLLVAVPPAVSTETHLK